ncbi:hypothetical protein [Microcoleus sp. D2_18a_D3]
MLTDPKDRVTHNAPKGNSENWKLSFGDLWPPEEGRRKKKREEKRGKNQ